VLTLRRRQKVQAFAVRFRGRPEAVTVGRASEPPSGTCASRGASDITRMIELRDDVCLGGGLATDPLMGCGRSVRGGRGDGGKGLSVCSVAAEVPVSGADCLFSFRGRQALHSAAGKIGSTPLSLGPIPDSSSIRGYGYPWPAAPEPRRRSIGVGQC
jgi:hypothetical protein